MKAKTLLMLSALSIGCGGAPNSFGGSEGSFSVRAALLIVTDAGVYVSLESEPRSEACAHWAQRVQRVPAAGLRVTTAPIAPGQYRIYPRERFLEQSPPAGASSELVTEDFVEHKATDGQLTFERVDLGAAPVAEGHFELEFAGGGSASGSFDATPCP